MPGTRKRLFAAALALFAVCLVLAGPAAAEGIDIDGSTVSGLGTNAQYYYTAAEVGFLTLNGGTWDYINVTGLSDLIVMLNGTNKIENGHIVTVTEMGEGYTFYSGIYVNGNLTIQNEDSDTVSSLYVNVSQNQNVTSILATNSLIIYGGDVNVTASGYSAMGICSDVFQISGGTVEVTANADTANAFGIMTDVSNIIGGTVETTVTSDNGDAYGIFAVSSITISTGEGVDSTGVDVTVMGKNETYGVYSPGYIFVSDSATVTVDADSANDAYGLFSLDGGLIISDSAQVESTVTSTSGSTKGIGSFAGISISDSARVTVKAYGSVSCGIGSVTGITISESAQVESTVTSTSGSTRGIGSFADISISGHATVTVDANGYNDAYCILSNSGNVTLSGSSVCADVHSEGGYAEGIYANSTISISGGSVTAAADSSEMAVYGIDAGDDVYISGSVVSANVYSENGYVNGIYAGDNISIEKSEVDSSEVYVTAASSTGRGSGVYASNIHISDSRQVMVYVTSEDDATGIYAVDSISIENSIVTASATGRDADSIYAEDGNVRISDSTVTTYSTGTNGTDAEATGIYANSTITLFGSNVTATAYAIAEGYGLYAKDGYISISDGKTLSIGTYQAIYKNTSASLTVASPLVVNASVNINGTERTTIPDAGNVVGPTYKYVFIGQADTSFHAVSYDSDGGYPEYTSEDTVTYPAGISIIVASGVSKDGYTFEEWLSGNNDAGIPGQPFTVPAQDVAFKAKWSINTYTITYNANGGTGSMNSVQETYGEYHQLAANAFTAPAGKYFAGWKIGSTLYDPAYSIQVTGDIDVYAQWKSKSSGGGGSSSSTPKEPETPVEPETPAAPGEVTVETEVTNGGEVSFVTPAVDGETGEPVEDAPANVAVSAVVLPTGTSSEVSFIPVSETPAPAGKETQTKQVFEINVPSYEKGKPATVKFTMTVAELEADGKSAEDVALWHFDEETGEWTRLLTTFVIIDGVVYFEAITFDFSPFAIIYEDADVPETPVVPETPASPAPVLAVLAGLGAALVLRRK